MHKRTALSSWRAIAVVGSALELALLAAVPMFAETCPVSPPPTAIAVVGPQCSAYPALANNPCPLNQQHAFTLSPQSGQYVVQTCDTVDWDFGDGTTLTTTGSGSAGHAYATAGRYVVTATIHNELGTQAAWAWPIAAANGYIGFNSDTAGVQENAGLAPLTVARSNSSTATSLNFATSDGGGYAGTRYAATSGSIVFTAGQSSATLSVPIIDNATFDGDATFAVTLSSFPAGYIAAGEGSSSRYHESERVTIHEDDPAPTVSCEFTHYVVAEGGSVGIRFTRSGDMRGSFSLRFLVVGEGWVPAVVLSGGEPTWAGNEGSLTFGPNETSKTLSVSVTDDDVYRGAGSCDIQVRPGVGTVVIASPPAGLEGVRSMQLEISDNEVRPALTVGDVVVKATNGGTATFPVSLSGKFAAPVTYSWTTSDGTAHAAVDYVASSGSSFIAAGVTSATIPVTILGINGRESRTFSLSIAVGSGAQGPSPVLAKSTAIATIISADAAGIPAMSVGVLAAVCAALALIAIIAIRE